MMQVVQIEFWQLLGYLGAGLVLFVGVIWAMGKLFLTQVDRRLEEKFAAQERARNESGVQWKADFAQQHQESREVKDRLTILERDFTDRQARLEERVGGLEESEKKHDDMYEMIGRSAEALAGLKATLDPMKAELARISNYLMDPRAKPQ